MMEKNEMALENTFYKCRLILFNIILYFELDEFSFSIDLAKYYETDYYDSCGSERNLSSVIQSIFYCTFLKISECQDSSFSLIPTMNKFVIGGS